MPSSSQISAIALLGWACFLFGLCVGQSTTPAPTVAASCDYCFLAPGFTDVSSSHEKEYLLFTAYSMTSTFAQDGFCATVSGASTSLQTPYSVAKPATATEDPAQFSSAAAAWFVNRLNVPDWGVCGENGSLAVHMADDANPTATVIVVNVAVLTVLGAVSQTSSLPPPSSTATSVATQSASTTGLSARAKAAIGIAFGLAFLVLLVPGLALWFRWRKRRAGVISRKDSGKLDTDTESETG